MSLLSTKTPKPEAPVVPYSLEDLNNALAERSLYEYMKLAWPTIEPEPFVDGWHIGCICEHLEAVSRGQIRDLVINVPPRHTKSLNVSVMWPSWEWGPMGNPQMSWLFTSYAGSLSIRDSVKCRRIIQSPWYQERWGNRYRLMGDQNAKERYDNDKGGYRLATSVGGTATGEGAARIVVDDPHNIKDVESDVVRQGVLEWWDQVMSTRANDPKTSARVIIMQRSHFADLSGHVQAKGGYEFLVLPAEYEPERSCVTVLGFQDPRKTRGELLWPNRYGPEQITALKQDLGTYGTAGQLQQRPSPLEGGIIKRNWWRYYTQIPEKMDFIYQTWDMAFKDQRTNSRVSGQVWGVKSADHYFLDEICDHLSFTKTLDAVRKLTALWPDATAKYVEEKANGAAVIDSLRHEIPGIIAVNPHESKEARASAVSPLVEAGNVWLPSPENYPWVNQFIEELTQFPNGIFNDRMDAFTQGVLETRKRARNFKMPPIVSMTQRSSWSRA